ncbi:MAG: sodium-translocating pyrophosphatase [Caldilineae bacterium]|nr:sodium-translocating pyrophosphatase [Chloroflexota bacterium]MCB9177503.1 sodium-translocating pyrophosphatase [Caldilineae bacterium]
MALQDAPAAVPAFIWLGPIGAIVALLGAAWCYRSVMAEDEGNALMREIAEAVREGAMAYLRAQYRVILRVFIGLTLLFAVLSFGLGLQNKVITFAFLTAGFFSGLAGFLGMRAATAASARTAQAASASLDHGLRVAFRAGAVMGLSVVGFALLDMSIWFLILRFGMAKSVSEMSSIMLGAAIGASTMALFGRVGGGIYTKAADVGADLVGKVEAGIPEDDPRNPATIADNVGDNVGDVAGMGADLYESYFASILATAALGVSAAMNLGFSEAEQFKYMAAPIMLAGVGVIISVLGIFLVRANEGATMKQLMQTLDRSVYLSAAGIAVLSWFLLGRLGLAASTATSIWLCVVTGILVGVAIGKITEYYTSTHFKPTQGIAEQANTGPATVIIDGLAVGMRSTLPPVIIVVIGSGLSFLIAGGGQSTLLGLFGVGMAAVGMLSTLGLTLATDAYGPIADNAGGNAEMSGLPPEVRQRTDQLDALGNTTAAVGKGFAIGSAALTGLVLLAAYVEQVRFNLGLQGTTSLTDAAGRSFDVATMSLIDFMDFYGVHPLNPFFLLGLFIGAMVAFYFCALTMSAVGRAAGAMVDEVRRQFREMPGIMTREQKPDYQRCVEISTKSALKEMVLPSLMAIFVPVLVGILMGVPGVLGLLSGGLATAFSLAVMMANAGGAWDNAKKYIEEGHHGGKGSPAHKAAVVGDTVGDPFKDTSGPSLNILIKLMSMVSVVFAGLITYFNHGLGILAALLQ